MPRRQKIRRWLNPIEQLLDRWEQKNNHFQKITLILLSVNTAFFPAMLDKKVMHNGKNAGFVLCNRINGKRDSIQSRDKT
jgi:hypothetical protein